MEKLYIVLFVCLAAYLFFSSSSPFNLAEIIRRSFRHRSLAAFVKSGRKGAVPYPLKSVDYEVALRENAQKKRVWKRFHPLGAVTEEDHEEWTALLREEMALKGAWSAASGLPLRQDEFWEAEGEDWRN